MKIGVHMGLMQGLRGIFANLGGSFHEYTDTGGKTVTVERKNASAYYANAYRACALAKARPLASLPVHVYERRDGQRAESSNEAARALQTLLRTRWNPYLMASEGVRWLDMTKDALGNAFVRVEYDRGVPVALWPLSSQPQVESKPDGPVFRYGGDQFTPAGVYLSNEIVWVKSPVIDGSGLFGVSLADLAAREIGLSIDLEDFYERLISNGNHFPGWLETDQKLEQQDLQRLREQLNGSAGLVEAGRVRIFDKGMRYHNTGYSMVDISLIEQEKWILQQTCRTLSVPPQEVFDLSHATYSNIEQGALNFANKTLVPECAEIERAFSTVLWDAGLTDCYVQFDMNGLLRGSYRDRMEGYRIAIYSGLLSRNECRALEDRPAYEGGDLMLLPTSYATVDPETGETEYPQAAGKGQGGSGEGSAPFTGSGDGDALDAIHEDMESRVRARFGETGDTEKFRDFATRVLSPYSRACTLARIPYDIDKDIERIIANEGH